MDLSHSDEQTALRDAADKVLRSWSSNAPPTAERWRTMADLGWLSLPMAAEDGGLGGTCVDVALLSEAFGRHLIATPYVSRAVLAAGLVAEGIAEPERSQRLRAIAEGRCAVAVVCEGLALDIDGAEALLVVDGTDAGQRVQWLRLEAPGLRLEPFATVDGRQAARVHYTAAMVSPSGPGRVAAERIEAHLDTARAALTAEAVGLMQAALDATVGYAKVREQFGRPIGANQVVKHRLVDMAIAVEEARSLALRAAIRCSDGSPAAVRANAVSGAKAKIADLARSVCEAAVQLHGAMGVTNELAIGQYLKRCLAIEVSYGTPRWHRARYAATRAALAEQESH
jgi:hypothetical protein